MRVRHGSLRLAMVLVLAPGCIDASDTASTEPDTAADEVPADREMAFVDENGDGVCDHQPTGRGMGRGEFVDADGDGVCDHQPRGRGEFVDADGDGVCDHQPRGRGRGRGKGRGEFVDADGDGVCDHYVDRADTSK